MLKESKEFMAYLASKYEENMKVELPVYENYGQSYIEWGAARVALAEAYNGTVWVSFAHHEDVSSLKSSLVYLPPDDFKAPSKKEEEQLRAKIQILSQKPIEVFGRVPLDYLGQATLYVFLTDGESRTPLMSFPVIDNANKPIIFPTVFDINTSEQRAATKLIALFTGLGMWIYTKEGREEYKEKQQEVTKLEDLKKRYQTGKEALIALNPNYKFGKTPSTIGEYEQVLSEFRRDVAELKQSFPQ